MMKVSRYELELASKVADRAMSLYALNGESKFTALMDIANWHEHSPLQLSELLAANEGDFFHDVAGIRRHIDRRTGKPEDGCCFMPRYSLVQS